MMQWQFGDFQTPDILAQKAVRTLKRNHHLNPEFILEPTCGIGAFIRAALHDFSNSKIIGFDINKSYVMTAQNSIHQYQEIDNLKIEESDFFRTNWHQIISEAIGYILIIGNPPWVTSSELSILNSKNIPEKSNFQNRRGIESITGAGNFDISEWMLLKYLDWLADREGTIAVFCKYSVARKVMRQLRKRLGNYFSCSIYSVDAKAYFNASVEACFFVLSTSSKKSDCKVYNCLDSIEPSYVIGERNGWIISNIVTYEKWKHLAGQDLRYVWRSGVKHDCSKVMVLERVDNAFRNGFGKTYILEEEYLYPLLKSSDVGNSRTNSYRKLALITQKSVGEDTTVIQNKAPRTWQYLLEHDRYLSNRKSSIYKNKPSYSIFGVGSYTFKKWKIAISGLYKKLNFNLIYPLDGKAVIFDDTINFLSFDTEDEAQFVLRLLMSEPSLEFLDSMIFWDEKRPITIDILKRLSLKAVARELGCLEQYLAWTGKVHVNSSGQLELGLAEKRSHYNF